MRQGYANFLFSSLRAKGIDIAPGLDAAEFNALDIQYALRFPPDLRCLLSLGLPTGEGFPDWRTLSRAEIHRILREPVEGVLFDVSVNGFWYGGWGPRPIAPDEALSVADQFLSRETPRLIPVFGHRYIPDTPPESGNPIFSVVQTDVVCFGRDLPDYFTREFGITLDTRSREEAKQIRFWSDLVG